MRRALRIATVAVALLAALAAAGSWWGYGRLTASLPVLDGRVRLQGLSERVSVERDALGIPTIRGGSRPDVARATGFLHAQDRFFQMDLARRRAAGELAALVGAAALRVDRQTRLHRLRAEAQEALPLLPPADRALLDAYTEGVNTGLAALAASPFEYLLLRQAPSRWLPEDTLLVILSMFLTLQDEDGDYESTLATMHDVLPQEMFDLLAPAGTEWDAPVVGLPFETGPVPGPEVYNLRRMRTGKPEIDLQRREEVARLQEASPWTQPEEDVALGSNSWAVGGRLTSDGGALVANDMHLAVRVPNTWYRARLEWPNADRAGEPNVLVGTTLPGVPTLVTGSNTYVAWGFTNTYADWTDLVLLDVDVNDANRYQTPAGWQRFDQFDEVVHVAGGPDEHVTVRWSAWGPVVGADHKGRLRAARWVGHAADRLAASITPLEQARTLEETFDAANGAGVPGQNLVVAERSGRVGWTIFGAIPNRVGMDGRFPESWADGWRGWNGWLNPIDYPRLIDPPGDRIWTANARVVDGAMLDLIGDGSYEIGSRARIIRERLRAKERFEPGDFLSIQLDDSALFLERWRALLLHTLASPAASANPKRSTLRGIVERDWQGRALPGSAGYRFTRAFRDTVSRRVFAFLLADCREADPRCDYTLERKREGPLWALVTERPLHFLDPAYASWDAFLIAAVDAMIQDAEQTFGADLSKRTWGEVNRTRYRHPLSAAVPLLGRWLDMPEAPVPGDLYTPRMAYGADSASERFVVSPGREAEGIMHMPTGQSGHPFSPHYGDSHPAWVKGDPTPFRPGPAVHTLTLSP